jgi:hypothetical protein
MKSKQPSATCWGCEIIQNCLRPCQLGLRRFPTLLPHSKINNPQSAIPSPAQSMIVQASIPDFLIRQAKGVARREGTTVD